MKRLLLLLAMLAVALFCASSVATASSSTTHHVTHASPAAHAVAPAQWAGIPVHTSPAIKPELIVVLAALALFAMFVYYMRRRGATAAGTRTLVRITKEPAIPRQRFGAIRV